MLSRIIVLITALCPAIVYATPPLSTPWPCEVSYRITQGHNGGSHTGKGAWAWDIGIPQNAEVTAPADGIVRRVRMDSNRGGCDVSYGNDANHVIIDFGDGTEALLLHLAQNSSTLKVGDSVKRGEVVGRVGLTGWVCGAHLHFQIQQTCNSYWCQSIPANFESYGNPVSGTFASDNCPSCEAVATRDETTLVDEKDPGCFKRKSPHWWSVSEGQAGHHYFTYGADTAAPEALGEWFFDVAEAGDYDVEVHIPQTEAESRSATYTVFDGVNKSTVTVNQNQEKGWVRLGTYAMSIGERRYVSLGDNTGESVDLLRKLAYDAVRVIPFVPEPEPEPKPEPEPEPDPTEGESETDPMTPLPPPPEPDGTTESNQDDGDGAAQISVDSGCNGMGAGASWFFLMAMFYRRRRR